MPCNIDGMNTYRTIPGGDHPDQGFYVVMTDDKGTEMRGTHRFPTRGAAQAEIDRLEALGQGPV
jgi:hypothetical protein